MSTMNIDATITKALNDKILKEVLKDLDIEALKKEAIKGIYKSVKEYFSDDVFVEHVCYAMDDYGIADEVGRQLSPQLKAAMKKLKIEIK